jgi:hypothetical protein
VLETGNKYLFLNAKSKPRNVILISGIMNLGCPSAPIWVGLLTFFRPLNDLLCGCLAVQWMFDGCFECPSTTSVKHPWDCPVLCGLPAANPDNHVTNKWFAPRNSMDSSSTHPIAFRCTYLILSVFLNIFFPIIKPFLFCSSRLKNKSHNTFRPIVRAIKKQKQKWVPFRWEKYFE